MFHIQLTCNHTFEKKNNKYFYKCFPGKLNILIAFYFVIEIIIDDHRFLFLNASEIFKKLYKLDKTTFQLSMMYNIYIYI